MLFKAAVSFYALVFGILFRVRYKVSSENAIAENSFSVEHGCISIYKSTCNI